MLKALRFLPFALSTLAPLASHACSSEPFIGSMCIMAWPKANGFGGGMYLQANGAQLPMSNYQALFAVIGFTYGGNNSSIFNLPDLRGRTIIGAGQGPGLPAYLWGQAGGAATATLTTANLPSHVHDASTAAVNVSMANVTAKSTLSGLAATTSMAGVQGTVAGSAFALNAYNGNGGASAASGAALATANGPASKIYASNAPNVPMAAGSISGNANVAFAGNPTTSITGGSVTTTLTGAPTATLQGSTGVTGGGNAFSVMQPYVPMTIYIAVNGLFPTVD